MTTERTGVCLRALMALVAIVLGAGTAHALDAWRSPPEISDSTQSRLQGDLLVRWQDAGTTLTIHRNNKLHQLMVTRTDRSRLGELSAEFRDLDQDGLQELVLTTRREANDAWIQDVYFWDLGTERFVRDPALSNKGEFERSAPGCVVIARRDAFPESETTRTSWCRKGRSWFRQPVRSAGS